MRTTFSRIASLAVAVGLCFNTAFAAGKVLIITNEFPQMELLVKILKTRADTTSDLVDQKDIHGDITGYEASARPLGYGF
jgi:hypothetical protein